MRKLIVEEWISIDGYAADSKGRTEFFPSAEDNRQSDQDQLHLMDEIDTILIGRKTYEIFADYWPKASSDKEIMAEKLNSIPKAVLSNSLKEAPWGKWSPATILTGDGITAVKKLKQENGKTIIVWGSISLVQDLMNADLIDEYRIQICPVRLGVGRHLFPKQDLASQFRLNGSKVYDKTGVVLLKYLRNR